MQMTELIDAARFVVDSDGRKKAVLLDYDCWLELLEDKRSTGSAALVRKPYRGSRPKRN